MRNTIKNLNVELGYSLADCVFSEGKDKELIGIE